MSYTKRLKINIFTFAEQLLRNLIISGCAVIVVALLMAHFFNFANYVVLSNSMWPTIQKNDVVMVKKQQEYHVGDILQFYDEESSLNIVHRLIGLTACGDQKVFICCGDNVLLSEQEINEFKKDEQWKNNVQFVENLKDEELKNMAYIQLVKPENVQGKVVFKLRFLGKIINFVKQNFGYVFFCIGLVYVIFSNMAYLNKEKYFITFN